MTDTTDQSRRAQKAPLPPEVLADARHDRTHENSGRLLKASPIVVSDHAALLRDLDSAAAGIQRLDRLDAEHIAKAIRALEAKVREAEDEYTGYVATLGKALRDLSFAAQTTGGTAGRDEELVLAIDAATSALSLSGVVQGMALVDQLRADRDRLAGEVKQAQRDVESYRHAAIIAEQGVAILEDTNARLTSELAAARENEARYLLLREPHEEFDLSYCKEGHEAWEYIFREDLDAAIDDAIDAARRAGEGEK